MKVTDAITVTIEVAVDPATAFTIFTEEVDRWWRPGPINWNDSTRAVGMRFEAGAGGRWIEVYDEATGEGLEIGRILVWEPGSRLVFLYRDAGRELDETEVEVRFMAVEGGTRVTLEHRGWDKVLTSIAAKKREIKRWGWNDILNWFSEWTFWGSPRRIAHTTTQPKHVKGYVLKSGEGVPDTGGGVKASKISTGGNLTLIESRTTGGAALHVHSREDEYFYVLDGAISVCCGEDTFEAGPRSFVFLPRGIPHSWDVIGGETATVLIITAPAGLEEFLDEYHRAGSASIREQVSAKHGITWIRKQEKTSVAKSL